MKVKKATVISEDKNKLIQMNYNHVWHPFTQMKEWLEEEPIFIEQGDGNYLIDIEGNRYLDAYSSLWANVHGHNRIEINDAIEKQLKKISHSTMLGLANIPATHLAKKLVDLTPASLNKVFYSDSGATAVEIALKMAYQYWQQKQEPVPTKKKFVTLKEAYHGDTIGSVSLGGIQIFHDTFSPLLFETYEVPTPFYYRSHYHSQEECKQVTLNAISDLFNAKSHEITGLFIEPYVQGAAGMIVYPDGFMKELYDLCKKHQILFIVDEVATGFGRTGKMFACENDNLQPDLMTLGKGITGGYLPLAATLASDEIYNAFLGEYSEYKAFFHGHTYTGNQLASSAALASLEIFEKEDVIYKLKNKIELLTNELERFKKLKHLGEIRQKGFMIGLELVKDKQTKEPFASEKRIGHKVILEARRKGIMTRPLGDVIILMPLLSITEEEIKTLCSVLYDSIKIVTEN